ncbi:hypothetical protein ACHWQZ_G012463 [Mnemiopsis leidyi]
MMIGYRYPIQGLQPFTKTFGQPLHEPDPVEQDNILYEDREQGSMAFEDQLANKKHDHDAMYVASQIEKSMGFTYGDDSDGDDSDVSGQLETHSEDPVLPDEDDDFLAAHSDILPADAPIDTINTLKALKYHIETSENRCFTNLERQLLATIVQHGIFNAGKDNTSPNSGEQKSSEILESSVTRDNIAANNENRSQHVGTSQTSETQMLSDSQSKEDHITENIIPAAQSTPQHNLSKPSSVSQLPPHLAGNYIRENSPSDSQTVSRKALLPTPGSYEEVSHVLMSETEGSKNFSKPMLPINEQKKLSKTVKSLKISEKLARIQNSYHPDDEPTLQLLESMSNKNVEESGYDDLLASYSKTKSQLEMEPKYKSKTKIIPPSSEFLKRQEKHQASRHERYSDNMQYSSLSHSSTRRVVSRDEYERERRQKEQEHQPTRRKVKVHYKEDNRVHSKYGQGVNTKHKKSKSVSPEIVNNQTSVESSEEKAVDILADLITQKFLSTMTEVEDIGKSKPAKDSVLQTISQPSSTVSSSFSAPPFISNSAPFLPPPQLLATPMMPIISTPLPLVTAPMMSHPGPIERQNLIQINLDPKKKLPEGNDVKNQIIDLDPDIEEGEIS